MTSFQTNSRALKWFESRLPVVSFVHHHLVAYPVPKNLNLWYSFGSIAGILLVLQIVTGIVLAMHYVPHGDMAFASVEHIMRNVNFGWLLRYMHSNGASMFFIAVYIHMFRGLYYGSYKAPREVLWWLGILILLTMMATAFMGYVLPWGQMSFWGATVITNLFSAIPGVGETIVAWLWGGFAVDDPTLNRFFSLHYLLPFVLVGIVILHLWALHTSRSNNPLGLDPKGPQDLIPFHPYYTVKDLLGFALFGILFAVILFFLPNALGEPDNYIPADPLVTPLHIVPEWYFLPFYAILRSIPDKLLGVIAMFGSIFILFLLPWLDTSRVRSAAFRPVFRILFWVFLVDCLVLGYIGANPPEGIYLVVGRITTTLYFLFFLALPFIGWFERPRPLPESISAAVVQGKGGTTPERATAQAERRV